VTYTLHFIPGCDLDGEQPGWFFGHFATAATGEAVRQQCAHPECIEVIEEEPV